MLCSLPAAYHGFAATTLQNSLREQLLAFWPGQMTLRTLMWRMDCRLDWRLLVRGLAWIASAPPCNLRNIGKASRFSKISATVVVTTVGSGCLQRRTTQCSRHRSSWIPFDCISGRMFWAAQRCARGVVVILTPNVATPYDARRGQGHGGTIG